MFKVYIYLFKVTVQLWHLFSFSCMLPCLLVFMVWRCCFWSSRKSIILNDLGSKVSSCSPDQCSLYPLFGYHGKEKKGRELCGNGGCICFWLCEIVWKFLNFNVGSMPYISYLPNNFNSNISSLFHSLPFFPHNQTHH